MNTFISPYLDAEGKRIESGDYLYSTDPADKELYLVGISKTGELSLFKDSTKEFVCVYKSDSPFLDSYELSAYSIVKRMQSAGLLTTSLITTSEDWTPYFDRLCDTALDEAFSRFPEHRLDYFVDYSKDDHPVSIIHLPTDKSVSWPLYEEALKSLSLFIESTSERDYLDKLTQFYLGKLKILFPL